MHEPEGKKITVAIPCFNEEITVGKVVSDFRAALPSAEIVVFDNASTDQTIDQARAAGAQIKRVLRRGKGNVVQHIFQEVDADILVMVDGDDTYEAGDVSRLIQPLLNGEANMVVGNRFTKNNQGFSHSHHVGNTLFRHFLNVLFRTKYSDILSGYRAMSREFYKNVPILSPGFEVETELTLQALERGHTLREVKVLYRDRPRNSHSKIHEFRDGSQIILTIISLLRDYRPMIFFSLIGGTFLLLGLFFGSIVVSEYLRTGYITRVPTAILTIALVLVGVNAFISGLILSAVNRRYREMEIIMRRFKSE